MERLKSGLLRSLLYPGEIFFVTLYPGEIFFVTLYPGEIFFVTLYPGEIFFLAMLATCTFLFSGANTSS